MTEEENSIEENIEEVNIEMGPNTSSNLAETSLFFNLNSNSFIVNDLEGFLISNYHI